MKELIKTDKNGTKYFNVLIRCDRCGGSGIYTWGGTINGRPMYAGTCFRCGGSGKEWTVEKEYTPEYRAKLDAANEKRKQKLQEKWEAERKAREAERKAREAEAARKEAERIKAEAARKAISQYVGNEGDRLTATVTLEKEVTFEVPSFKGWGTDTKHIYIFVDDAGNKLDWKTTGSLGCWIDDNTYRRVDEGDKVNIKATVKGHGEYNGEKQTEIQRVKLVA